MEQITLRFVRDYGVYNKHDVASFPAAAAKLILEAGAAQAHDVPPQREHAVMPERKSSRIVKKSDDSLNRR